MSVVSLTDIPTIPPNLPTQAGPSQMTCSRKIILILGDGQLGRMLAEAALKLNISVKVLSKQGRHSSAGAIAECLDGDIKKGSDIARLSIDVDALIPEVEHIDVTGFLASGNQTPMYPSAQTIQIIQDKFGQKEFFAKAGIPIGEYCDIPDSEALKTATKTFGFPCMLKSKRGAFDGRGNYVLRSLEDPNLQSRIEEMGGYHNLYLEKWQQFTKEIAVIVVRGKDNEIKNYPVTETVQHNNICFVTETPPLIEESVQQSAERLARQAVLALNDFGVFGVEMFLLSDSTVLFNELAPRVHNSGHYTIDGCPSSQFENHIRVAADLPLGDTRQHVPHIIMYNLLGEKEGERIANERIEIAQRLQGCYPKWYEKFGEIKLNRKIGHINIIGTTRDETRLKLKQIDEKAYELLSKNSPLPERTLEGRVYT